jgi:hypothetical protein
MTTGAISESPVETQSGGLMSESGEWISAKTLQGDLLLWNANTGETWRRRPEHSVDVLGGVTNGGYVLAGGIEYVLLGMAGPAQPIGFIQQRRWGFDVRNPATPEYDLAAPTVYVQFSGAIAEDSSRVAICTGTAMISADTNDARDCYLIPFPPSPLAG